jgi:pimeloyl-ACP methyl ester carboxylesterase
MATVNLTNGRGTISYTERGGQGGGAAPPLVLVHGFPLDSRMWNAQLDDLSNLGRVIAIDLKGFGQSKSNDPFTIKSQAEILHEALAQIGALPLFLAGLSMGGYIALAFARKFPADLKGLILIDTKAEGDTADGKAARNKMIELVRTGGAKAVADQMMGKMLAADTIQHRPARTRPNYCRRSRSQR